MPWLHFVAKSLQGIVFCGFNLVILEIARRQFSNRGKTQLVKPHTTSNLKKLSNLTNYLLTLCFLTLPLATPNLNVSCAGRQAVQFLFNYLIYRVVHKHLVLAPFFKKEIRERLFLNIGPGLAHAFGAATRKTLTNESLKEAFLLYAKSQEIGPYNKSSHKLDFLTSRMVILLPKNLERHVNQFKELNKEYLKKFPTADLLKFCPTDSQGLCEYEQMVVKLSEGKRSLKVKQAPQIQSGYTSAGQSRFSVSSVLSWDENPETRWYFRSFDVKPLMDIVDCHEEFKDLDLNDTYYSFLKTFIGYLESFKECAGTYYIHFYDGPLSSSMPTLMQMVKETEGHVGTPK